MNPQVIATSNLATAWAQIERLLAPAEETPVERQERGHATSLGRDSSADYYDQHTSPLRKRRYLDLARRGAFPTSKIGKLVLARRVDVDGYIASRTTTRRPLPSAPEPSGPSRADVDAILSSVGLRRNQ